MKNVIKVFFGTAILFSAWATAQSELVTSTPMDGATLSESPKELLMGFSDEVSLTQVMLHSDDGKMHPLDFSMAKKPKANYDITVSNALPSGGYTVYWSAKGGDSRKVSGDFSFTVK